MKKEEKLEKLKKRKIYLILTKYLPHIIGLMLIIYTLGEFAEIDMIPIGHLFSLSVLPWIYSYSASWALEFCYVHRLPLYYILLNEILLLVDNYFRIPIGIYSLLLVHLLLIGFLIIGYTYYYVTTNNKNNTLVVD